VRVGGALAFEAASSRAFAVSALMLRALCSSSSWAISASVVMGAAFLDENMVTGYGLNVFGVK